MRAHKILTWILDAQYAFCSKERKKEKDVRSHAFEILYIYCKSKFIFIFFVDYAWTNRFSNGKIHNAYDSIEFYNMCVSVEVR